MIKAVVTDIEGTTSSLSFVKDVLFPYAREYIGDFVAKNGDKPEVKALLVAVAEQAGLKFDVKAIVSQILQWMDEDKKFTPLKLIQGLIWEEGYHKGSFKGHVYPDAIHYLQLWHKRGMALYVYSSGSVHAQKLLFSHTQAGDLTPLFTGYFDTKIGAKRDSDSYRAITTAIDLPATNILFLSDIKEELDAAKSVGFATAMLDREGMFASCPGHTKATDFSGVDQMLNEY